MEYRPADFSYWDTVEHFTLTEAAWLWCDLEPPARGFEYMPIFGQGVKPHPLIPNLPAKGDRAARAMWQDATESETTNRLIWLTNYPDTRYLFPRRYLRAWAENHSDYRPRFLFPEAVKPSRPRITERSEEYKRWRACGEKIQQERMKSGKPPLRKIGLASEVIERLNLSASTETVRKQL